MILVAEDSATQAEWVRVALEDAGHRVAVVGDGQEALARSRAGDVELILADVEMPGMDGFELCRRLKDDPDLRRIPVVILTQRDRVTDVIRALEVGADNYLTKPFPAEELIARVERLLSEIDAWRQRSRAHRHRLSAHTDELVLTFERTQVVEMLMGAAEKLESELSTVGEIVLGLTMDHDLDELLVVVADRTRELAEATVAGVALDDAGDGPASLRAISGGSTVVRQALAAVVPGDWGLTRAALRLRDPIILRGREAGAALDRIRAADPSIGTVLVVPLVVADRSVGKLAILFAGHRLLPSDELRRYRTLGDQAAVAIENARLFERERRTLAELRAVLDATSDGIVVVDERHDVLDANPAALRLLDTSAEDLVEKGFDALPAASKATLGEVITQGIADATVKGEVSIERTDGQRRTIDYAATANVLPGRHLLVLHDVTERQEMEQRLFQAARLESIGRVAGGIAHDFNNLLMAISGFATLLDDGLAPDSDLRADVRQISRAADRATQLTRQLLSFSRQQHLQPTLIDPAAFVDDAAPLIRRLVGPEIELVLRASRPTGSIRVDPTGFEQVIVNLVVNARDAMPEGGRLTIDTEATELDEAYARGHPSVRPGRYVAIGVTDTGVGMDEATLQRIFEPFFTTKPIGEGTGLGLASAHGFVNQSSGHITAHSEPGLGTTVRVFLPRLDRAPAAPSSPLESTAPARGTETILVAEDDSGSRELVRRALESYGYRVLVAPDADQALDAWRSSKEPIAALVTDLVLPGMSGPELATAIGSDRPGLPILYMSGYSADFAADSGVLGPGAAFLQKPFAPSDLARRVREILDVAGNDSA